MDRAQHYKNEHRSNAFEKKIAQQQQKSKTKYQVKHVSDVDKSSEREIIYNICIHSTSTHCFNTIIKTNSYIKWADLKIPI